MHILHDWFYWEENDTKGNKTTFRRCNKCGKKQYYWASGGECGWQTVKKASYYGDINKLERHISLLLKEIDILKKSRPEQD